MIATAMNKQQLDVEHLAQLPLLELLTELQLLGEPTVICLMDKLIGKRQPDAAGAASQHEPAEQADGGISPIQKYMLRLMLFGAGETIMHRGRLCEVVETHPYICQLMPLINKDLSESKTAPFWVPSNAVARKEMRLDSIRRNQEAQTLFRLRYTGEPRPYGARRVPLHSNYPSTPYLTHLVKELGYNGHAAFAATIRGHLPQLRLIDRRGGLDKSEGVGVHPDCPYISMASDKRTTVGDGFRKEQVTTAIAGHRWDDKHSAAVFEIVYLRRKPDLVAASLGLKLTTVYQYCSRVRADLGAHNLQESGADLRVKDFKSFVFSESV